MEPKESPEYRAFQQCYGDLVCLLSPVVGHITTELFTRELISQSIFHQVHTIGIPDDQKVSRALDFVHARIRCEPGKFGQFVDTLRASSELRDLADKLETYRDKLQSCQASVMRSGPVALPSTPPTMGKMAERSFPYLAGIPATKQHSGMQARPACLPLEKKHSATNITVPSPHSLTRPIPCTDKKDTEATPPRDRQVAVESEVDKTESQKEVSKYKDKVKELEEALSNLRIEADRKLGERELTVNVLSQMVQKLFQENEGWREYAQSLLDSEERLKLEKAFLEEKVVFYEDDRARVEAIHEQELEKAKLQLQTIMDDMKELLAQLEDHRKLDEKERKASKPKRRQNHKYNSL